MTTPPASSLAGHFDRLEAQLKIALDALRYINSDHCPQRKFEAGYALISIGKLDDEVKVQEDWK